MTQPALLQLDEVSCWHGAHQAVESVNLVLRPGDHVALIGGNGSGKTTLLRAVLGLHPRYAGRIRLDGKEARTAADWQARRRRIAYMPQRQVAGQFPLRVHELLASSQHLTAALGAAQKLGVSHLSERPLHTLSGGQLQRVFLARALGALSAEAGLLIADEPSAALDFAGQTAMAEALAELSATLLIVTHDRRVVARCTRVVEMAGGRLSEVGA